MALLRARLSRQDLGARSCSDPKNNAPSGARRVAVELARGPVGPRIQIGSPSPATPATAVTAPAAPSTPAAGLGHRSYLGRGLPDDRDIRRRRYRRYRAHERIPAATIAPITIDRIAFTLRRPP